MTERKNLQNSGDRIEQLLADIRSMASPQAWERVQEAMHVVVELYGEGLRRIVDIVATPDRSSGDIARELLADDLIESLLLLHDLHPEDFASRVRSALDHVRPYLGSHGGGIELVSADRTSGLVRLRLGGTCDGCPSSLLTVKVAVESAIRERAPETTEIEVEGVVDGHHESRTTSHAGNGNHEHSRDALWIGLDEIPDVAPGTLAAAAIDGAKVLLCRLGGNLYAYRDRCPACGSTIESAALAGDLLTCPSCAEPYDIRLAGRSTRQADLHLEPLPLLQDPGGVRIALSTAGAER